jgi:hypothetical protein
MPKRACNCGAGWGLFCPDGKRIVSQEELDDIQKYNAAMMEIYDNPSLDCIRKAAIQQLMNSFKWEHEEANRLALAGLEIQNGD